MQIIFIRRFASHISVLQFQAEFRIDFFRMLQGNFHKLSPQRQHSFITALQFHNVFTRQISKRRIFIKTHFCIAVELLQVRQFKFSIILLLFNQICHQHTKLRPPIADMVLTNDLVSQKFQHTRNTVANNRRAQMPNVHFFGKIRRRIVNHNGIRRSGFFNIQAA